mmetsp:Transcript_75/g.197  ORF Transcript_75/g.197 Transcript_75/m.197 type:complete len:111 (-) Transcript_75:69-401(-)
MYGFHSTWIGGLFGVDWKVSIAWSSFFFPTRHHGQAKSLKTLTLMCLAGFVGVDIEKEGSDWAQIASIKKIGCTKLRGEKDMDTRGSTTICKLGCYDVLRWALRRKWREK